jgi:prepilin-type N-terminal cleavage/methylation domain-containing protein
MIPLKPFFSRCGRIGYPGGFTLVELLITLVLSVLLIGGAALLFISGRVAIIDTERLSRAQENLRFLGNFVMQDLRMTGYRVPTNFLEQANTGELLVRYVGPNDCLGNQTSPLFEDEVLDRPGIATNRFFLQDGRLFCEGKRQVQGVLVDGISAIEFEPVPNALNPLGVTVSFGVEGPGGDEIEYSFNVAFRNRILQAVYPD